MEELIVVCPHCSVLVLIEQLNCCIFRHAVFKNNFEPIHPHLPKVDCEKLIFDNLVYGCARPFQIVPQEKTNTFIVKIIDYI